MTSYSHANHDSMEGWGEMRKMLRDRKEIGEDCRDDVLLKGGGRCFRRNLDEAGGGPPAVGLD